MGFSKSGRLEYSSRGTASNSEARMHPGEFSLHQNCHELGEWVLSQFRKKLMIKCPSGLGRRQPSYDWPRRVCLQSPSSRRFYSRQVVDGFTVASNGSRKEKRTRESLKSL